MVKYSLATTLIVAAAFSNHANVNAYSMQLTAPRSSSFIASSNRQTFALPRTPSVSPYSQPSFPKSTTNNRMTMLIEPSGKDALDALSSTGTTSKNPLRKAPSTVRNAISTASIPAGAILGFALTPGNKIVANALGAGITGILGSVGKSKIDSIAAETAKPAIAQLLLDNFDSWDANVESLREDVVKVAKQNKVDIESGDLNIIAMDIYARFLMAMCKNPYAKTTELKELSNLRSILNLSNLDLGEAHSIAASEFYRTTCLFTPEEELEDEEHPDRMSLDKLLWLSSRAISSASDEEGEDGDGAYIFEMSRISKALKVSFPEDVRERVQSVAEPFYERALKSTRTKLDSGQVSSAMLDRARNTLGIDDFIKRDMHVECYQQEVRELLGLNDENVDDEDRVFPEGSLERLKNLQTVLEIEDADAEYELATEITPLFQKTAIAVFDEACEEDSADAKTLWSKIEARQSELCLSSSAMKPLMESAVVQKLGTPLDAAMNFAKVSNEGGAHDSLMEALKVKSSVFSVLEQYPEILAASEGEDEYSSFDDKFFSPSSKTTACGFIPSEDRQKLYTLFLSRAIKESTKATGDGMTSEMEEQLDEIAKLLAMSEYQVSNAARGVCGPLVEKELKAAALEVTGDDWTPVLVENLKKRIDDLVERMNVPEQLVKEYGMNMYKDSLRIVALKCPNGIPTKEMFAQLTSLQGLLSLSSEDVSAMHLAAFANSYKKSVLEAMGSTGVIREEFREPLVELVERLGISDDDAQKLFLSAVEDKMKPKVQLIANELERSMLTQQQLAQKKGQDMGQDVFKDGSGPKGTLGIGTDGNVMGEIMNLIDFYKENDIREKKQTGTKKVEKTVDEETVTEEVPIYEYTYPITALSMSAIEGEMADALYRQFVVGGFTAQGSQQARYEAETATFGSILGLSKERMDVVGGEIGSMVYENYIKNALQSKDSLDQQDMMFLATMQQKLNLDGEQGAEMMQNAQKKVLFEQANAVFSTPTAPAIKALREKCNSMGLEMYEDVGLPKDRLESMFGIEVTAGIDAGEITTETAEIITEIQESLGLAGEDCQRILEGIIERKTVDAIYKIEKELLRGRDENCVSDIKEMLKYAAFLGGEVEGVELTEETANKIINIYDSVDMSDVDPEVVQENKELLRIAVGLEK